MPALHPPAKVLVTGANGFVGCWVVYQLLEAGYAVRAAVRTSDKARTLTSQLLAQMSKVQREVRCALGATLI